MTIQEVIEKAIEGGYEVPLGWSSPWGDTQKEICIPVITSDPLFWESLGKAMGWSYTLWKDKWHDFIGHLADGGTPESFFKNL